MNIAVLSGKGGTGKTTISTNMAMALKASYVDCDVEEPNGFLFLEPKPKSECSHNVNHPVVDEARCVGCKKCVEACNFNALAMVQNKVMIFEKLCHDCGACKIACEYDAISFKPRNHGLIQRGVKGQMKCVRGVLNIGEPMAPPLIKSVIKGLDEGMNIIDCPPGTSCNVVSALRYSDAAILVTEPSVFGLHDLKMAIELVKMFKIPFAVVINKDDGKDNLIKKHCREEGISIIGEIPYKKETAVLYSTGKLLYDHREYKEQFDNMASRSKEVLGWN